MTGTSHAGRLLQWRRAFDSIDECPWPGPRPLTAARHDKHLLIGRDPDRESFLEEVIGFRLVILTGDSGVGKTSLIEAGLVPDLSQAGHVVALCRDWSGGSDKVDHVWFVAEKVARALREGGHSADYGSGADFFWNLDDSDHSVVLVLDQFEELIRDAPELTDRILPFLAAVNQNTNIRLVISFRSEYVHELRALENKANAYTISHIHLEPVEPDFAHDLVLAGNTAEHTAITPAAATKIADAWTRAFGRQSGSGRSNRFGRIGLLHLQALLYSLHGETGGATITDSTIAGLGAADDIALFNAGMVHAIRLKLRRCRLASEAPDVALDPYLVEGTTEFVTDMVGHLSSVGYKLVRDAFDLWTASLGDGVEVYADLQPYEDLLLTVTAGIMPDGFERFDLLDASRLELTGLTPSWRDRLDRDASLDLTRNDDPREITCGAMMRMSPAAVLVEEIRRFAFALEWLRVSSLIRISTPSHDGVIVSLIHDGFGAALERWSKGESGKPGGAIHAITAPQGAQFGWQFDDDPSPPSPENAALDGASNTGLAVFPNLRWKGAWVRASFRNVVFVNSDLRGTYFDKCTFTGVSFINCLLDGALFSECRIVGSPAVADHPRQEGGPAFLIPAPRSLIDALAKYQLLESADMLYSSRHPGDPATPAGTDSAYAQDSAAILFEPDGGGLGFYGGRVSTLMFRDTRFVDGGELLFREVAGSGLDFVDQTGGRFTIMGSSVRHISVTRPINLLATDIDEDLVLALSDSIIAQLWIGEQVKGGMSARDCSLVQVWNGSDQFAATATESSYFDLVNVTISDHRAASHELGAATSLDAADHDHSVRRRARAMDYRRPTQLQEAPDA